METPHRLLNSEIERYGRQLLLNRWNEAAQLSLKSTHVILPARLMTCGLYLAAAGAGRITLCGDVGCEPFLRHLQRLNSDIVIDRCDVTSEADASEIHRGLETAPQFTRRVCVRIENGEAGPRGIIEHTATMPPGIPTRTTVVSSADSHLPAELLLGTLIASTILKEFCQG